MHQPITVKTYLKNCTLPLGVFPKDGEEHQPLCRRVEFTSKYLNSIYRFVLTITRLLPPNTASAQEHRIVRSCGWIKSSHPCAHQDSFDLTETVCQCFDDGCNGSAFVSINLATILFFLGAVLVRNWIKC